MPVTEVKIPPLGESINSGVIATWHVNDGDTVTKDQALFELETDKITSEGTAPEAGVISLKVEEGAEVKIGEVVATIDTDKSSKADPGDKDDSAAKETPAPKSAPDQTKTEAPKPAAPAQAEASADESKPTKAEPTLSPAVRRLAAETGLSPTEVEGTGKGGRVTKGDMLAAVEARAEPAPKEEAKEKSPDTPVENPKTSADAKQTRKKMSPLRAKIAERLVSAQHAAAMLTTFNEVDMSAVMALRAKHQDAFVKKHGLKLGFMSFFTKAVVHALQEVPAVNTFIDGTHLVQNHYYDIGVAVSTERGLMVPVIRDCEQLSMAGIEQAIGDVAKKARDGKITLPDLEGGVFTITNGGIFGSMLSTPILNAPQSAILGLHAINERPVAVDGQVVIRPMMYLALSYDHRVVDGREAVTFLVRVKEAVENPLRLFLGSQK